MFDLADRDLMKTDLQTPFLSKPKCHNRFRKSPSLESHTNSLCSIFTPLGTIVLYNLFRSMPVSPKWFHAIMFSNQNFT